MNKQFLESLLFIARQEETMEASYLADILSILYDIQHYDNNVIDVSYRLLKCLKTYGDAQYDYGYEEGSWDDSDN